VRGLRVVVREGTLAAVGATAIARRVRRVVARHGRCALALAGGSTPTGVYRLLASRYDIPWGRVLILFGDERCVPPDDPRSNFRMVHETLLGPLGSRAPRVLRMAGEDPSPVAAALRYERDLRANVPGDPPRIDLVLLGLGSDGHTAGLFPGDPRLDDDGGRLVVAVLRRPDGVAGLTLTPTALRAARQRLFLVDRATKGEAVRAVTAPGSALPAARFAPAVILCGRS